MSGTSRPSLDYAASTTSALNLAEVIYSQSERCLMAHTLRAVESFIAKEYQKPHFTIALQVEQGVQARWKSKSWIIIRPNDAIILIDEGLSRDQKRVCIAHECYHLLDQFRPNRSDPKAIEEICDHFANALCEQHNKFYRDPQKIAQCQFNGLPINAKRR